MWLHKSLLSVFLLLAIAHLHAQPPAGGMPPMKGGGMMVGADTKAIKNKYLDIAYANVSPSQKLDIYLPDALTGTFPVIMAIHGGAFLFGDKADGQLTPMLAGLKRGYAVVSINYRLSGESPFPAQISDTKAAIRWVKANAANYHLNPDKIGLWGGSAGGNLVSLAGTAAGVKVLSDTSLGNAGISDNVQAVVDWFGPINFLTMDEQFRQSGNGTPNHSDASSPESKLMGNKLTDVPNLVAQANPETYISKTTPPFFIEHGTKDNNVPTQQSGHFYGQL